VRRTKKFVYSYIFLILFLSIFFNDCKSPEAPEEPFIPKYRDNVEVIYTRDTSMIRYPEYENKVNLSCSLHDPFREGWSFPSYRMERIGENKFRRYLNHVFIQEGSYQDHHTVCVYDSSITPSPYHAAIAKGIKVEGAYDLRIVGWLGTVDMPGYALQFKMSKKQS